MKMVLKLTGRGALLLLLGAACAPVATPRGAPSGEAPGRVVRDTYLMGTHLRLDVEAGDRAGALQATERVVDRVRELEAVLSSWRDDSEIGRINSAPVGVPVQTTPVLWRLLDEARRWSERTGGSFDPAVGALIDAWDLRGTGRRPSRAELERARAASGLSAFRFDPAARSVTRLRSGAWLDTGGFGKGAALRDAKTLLLEAGVTSALLDFGGQVLAIGSPSGPADAWEVGVAHPSRRSEATVVLRLTDASAATTAQSERHVEVEGERFGHVLDPRTGEPVPAWGSVTVVAEDAMVADMLSTALFVMGPRVAREWAAKEAGVGVLLLEERDGRVTPSWNAAMRRYLQDLNGMDR